MKKQYNQPQCVAMSVTLPSVLMASSGPAPAAPSLKINQAEATQVVGV